MKALIQRVTAASVKIKNKEYCSINEGLCVFLGVKKSDTELDVKYLVEKIINLRLFSDKNNMNYIYYIRIMYCNGNFTLFVIVHLGIVNLYMIYEFTIISKTR